jgi:hypothetical protein
MWLRGTTYLAIVILLYGDGAAAGQSHMVCATLA